MQYLVEFHEKIFFFDILYNEDTRPTFRSRSTQMALFFLKCEIRSILLKRHQVDSVIKGFWPTNKLIKLCSIWWNSMKKSFYHILCNKDTRSTFHFRSTQMALRLLKCEIRSILLKRHQVDSVIKDFWPTYKLIKLCSIWWNSMKKILLPHSVQLRHTPGDLGNQASSVNRAHMKRPYIPHSNLQENMLTHANICLTI